MQDEVLTFIGGPNHGERRHVVAGSTRCDVRQREGGLDGLTADVGKGEPHLGPPWVLYTRRQVYDCEPGDETVEWFSPADMRDADALRLMIADCEKLKGLGA